MARDRHRPPCTPRALAILAGKALQGRFYAVYDVHQAILPTAAGVGQSVVRRRMTAIPPPPLGTVALILLLAVALAFVAYELAAW